jgi:hypothetical protein
MSSEYFPAGYLEHERLFCINEQSALSASKAHYKSPEKTMLRKALLKKRAEFRVLWDKGRVS